LASLGCTRPCLRNKTTKKRKASSYKKLVSFKRKVEVYILSSFTLVESWPCTMPGLFLSGHREASPLQL
jgi:hypothetical protein